METRRRTWKEYIPNSVRRVLRPLTDTLISQLPVEYRERLPQEIRSTDISRHLRDVKGRVDRAAKGLSERLEVREVRGLHGEKLPVTLELVVRQATLFYKGQAEREAYLKSILQPQLSEIAIAKLAGRLASEKEERPTKKPFAYIRGFIKQYAPEMADQILDKQGRIGFAACFYAPLIFDLPEGTPIPPELQRYIAPVSWSLRDVRNGGPLEMELTDEDVNAISYKPFSQDEHVIVIRPAGVAFNAPVLPSYLFKPNGEEDTQT